jgi:ribokinase
LGIDTSFIGRVGTDPLAQMLARSLADAGVEESGLQRDLSATTGLMYVVVTPDGERTIFGCRGANAQTEFAQIPLELLSQARVFHLSGYALLAEPQRSAALLSFHQSVANHRMTVLDPGMSLPDTALSHAQALLPDVDILLPNLDEARHLTGSITPEDCARALLKAGVRVVLIKLGGHGCLLTKDDEQARIPCFPVEPHDSTGAGDSFAAGVIAGALRGLDWASSALLGNAMGALAVGRVGGGAEETLPEQVLSVLDSGLSDPRFSRVEGSLARAADFMHTLVAKKNKRG